MIGSIILTAFMIVLAFLFVWAAFGNKKGSEDKAIGGLEAMAHFKASTYMDAMQRRLR